MYFKIVFFNISILAFEHFLTRVTTESIRKLSNFTFQWTRTLYQNNLKHSCFLCLFVCFFILFKGCRCNQLYVLTQENFLRKPEETSFKSFKFPKMNSNLTHEIIPVFSQFLGSLNLCFRTPRIRNCLWCYYR